MSTIRLIELITLKQSGEITLGQQVELNSLLQEKEYADLNDQITELFETGLVVENKMNDEKINASVDRLLSKLTYYENEKPYRLRPRVAWIKRATIAASIILFAGFAYLMFTNNDAGQKKEFANVIVTKKGSKTSVQLPDGTKVWINADTKLTYDKVFGNTKREVFLTGEAYFEVVKDKKRPFIVHTNVMDIKVLGTVFNVKAYTAEINSEATLIHGSIEVLIKNKNDKSIILKPNEKIEVRNYDTAAKNKSVNESKAGIHIGNIAGFSKDSVANEILWTKNQLVFDYVKFSEIAADLERWYNIDIVLKDTTVGDKKFSGVFENKSIEEVLDALRMVGKFSYHKKGNAIIIN